MLWMTAPATAADSQCSSCRAPLPAGGRVVVQIAHGRRQVFCETCGAAARDSQMHAGRKPAVGAQRRTTPAAAEPAPTVLPPEQQVVDVAAPRSVDAAT